ncbi:MAG TPA: serine/threonine-protein kinase, partial [Polyangia bacterium]
MIGETINNYRVSELLGEGGMGAVYLAEHPFMGRKAAIKVLRREFAEDRNLVERFMNEARAANAIRHPNIIDIIDVGRMPSGIPYLMMELLEGESLSQRIQRGNVPLHEAMDIILQTTSALAAAHAKGIVHRDLKPDNLYLVPDDAAPGGIRVKVLDFGIAKLRDDLSGGVAKTQAGSLMGTPP